jgi:protein-tyrosine phosphatase
MEMASAEGYDLSAHRSKLVTDDLLHTHELILVMEREHIQSIQDCTPEVAGRTMLMGHWSNQRDLPDPHRQSIEMYQAVFAQLREDLSLWIEKLD